MIYYYLSVEMICELFRRQRNLVRVNNLLEIYLRLAKQQVIKQQHINNNLY